MLAFFADEEAGGRAGSHWLVDNHPELFEGSDRGHQRGRRLLASTVRPDLRLYLVETAEEGLAWMKLIATGPRRPRLDGQRRQRGDSTVRGSRAPRDGTTFPVRVTKTVRAFLDEVSEALGIELDPDDWTPPSPSSARSLS